MFSGAFEDNHCIYLFSRSRNQAYIQHIFIETPNTHLTLAIQKACQLLHSFQAISYHLDSQGMTHDKVAIRKAALSLGCYQFIWALAKVRQKNMSGSSPECYLVRSLTPGS